MPGKYVARLTANGKQYSQEFTVKIDPRVKSSLLSLKLQRDLAYWCYETRKVAIQAAEQLSSDRTEFKEQRLKATGQLENDLRTSEQRAEELETGFIQLDGELNALFNILQDTDMPPTTQAIKAVKDLKPRWNILIRKLGN